MEVTNIKKNILGTVSFNAKFKGMRKGQDFIVYPNPNEKLTIQSGLHYGFIDKQGVVEYASAKYSVDYMLAKSRRKIKNDIIENFAELKSAVKNTASNMAGESYIYCDNSKAGDF